MAIPTRLRSARTAALTASRFGGVMRRLEHVFGIDRRCDVARQRSVERAGKSGTVGAVNQDRLADQRQIARTRAVFIRLADTFGKCRRNTRREERSDIELLPDFEIGP